MSNNVPPYVPCKQACAPDKICNFFTGRCVSATGKCAARARSHPMFFDGKQKKPNKPTNQRAQRNEATRPQNEPNKPSNNNTEKTARYRAFLKRRTQELLGNSKDLNANFDTVGTTAFDASLRPYALALPRAKYMKMALLLHPDKQIPKFDEFGITDAGRRKKLTNNVAEIFKKLSQENQTRQQNARARANAEAKARARANAEAQARARANAEAQARAQANAEARARARAEEAEAKARANADRNWWEREQAKAERLERLTTEFRRRKQDVEARAAEKIRKLQEQYNRNVRNASKSTTRQKKKSWWFF